MSYGGRHRRAYFGRRQHESGVSESHSAVYIDLSSVTDSSRAPVAGCGRQSHHKVDTRVADSVLRSFDIHSGDLFCLQWKLLLV